MTDVEIRQAIQAARRQHQTGVGTALDALRRLPIEWTAEWTAKFEAVGGVRVLADVMSIAPDFSQISREVSRSDGLVIFKIDGDSRVHAAMADPWSEMPLRKATATLGVMPTAWAASSEQFEQWLGGGRSAMAPQSNQVTPDGPVVEFVNGAVIAGFAAAASDLHFECDRGGVTVRFRQDGVMQRYARMADPQRAEEVISRIKVMAQLDITERRTPQDGRFSFAIDSQQRIDLRVSIMPSVHGEDAVLRLLDKAQLRSRGTQVSLDLLGFDPVNAGRIRALAELPHGMLLVTGPTGSGKTTTVYAVLSEINSGLEKVITIEDPVEYELPGVLQIPVNERKGLTFAKGLRSILRHDPDRILVGEIRDAETAGIAVQSALTGHQVFTTVHANSLFDVTGRFRHFDIDMFGFMSALNGVVVQRLMRCVCVQCAKSRPATSDERAWLERQGESITNVPATVGCEGCGGTGYKGRRVLAEVHVVDDRLRDMVVSNSPMTELRVLVDGSGVTSLARGAAAWIRSGVTTPEEVKRVVGWA